MVCPKMNTIILMDVKANIEAIITLFIRATESGGLYIVLSPIQF